MANAKPAKLAAPNKPEGASAPKEPPKVEYFGEGAENIKFEVDPKATRIRVFADGRILTDY